MMAHDRPPSRGPWGVRHVRLLPRTQQQHRRQTQPRHDGMDLGPEAAPAAAEGLLALHGIQAELSQPVALLLNEDTATITLANQAGFRCFTDGASFRRYVKAEVLAEVSSA